MTLSVIHLVERAERKLAQMLHKPDIPDEKIIACLREEYDLRIIQVNFLTLGFGMNTAVYRAIADDKTEYFCKLNRSVFDFTSVEVSKFLSEQGIEQIIPPLTTKSGQLCVDLEEFNLIVYPFVEGKNGYEVDLTDHQWMDLGMVLKRIHTTVVPPALIGNIQMETFSSTWRERCKQFLARLDLEPTDDVVVIDLVALLSSKRELILNIIRRAEQLAPVIATRNLDFVLCHSDLHPGNVLIDEQGRLFIVDWDYPKFSPKESDLMYIGGGYGFLGHFGEEEETLFYSGYGQPQIDPIALAYYRLERSIICIAVACEQILSSEQDELTRTQCFEYLKYYFRPNGAIETALKFGEIPLSLTNSVPKNKHRKSYISAPTLIFFITLLIIWQLIAQLSNLPSFILPSPVNVWLRFLRTLEDGSLFENSLVTLFEVLMGLVAGSLGATVMGYLMAKSRLLENILSPFVVVSQAVPFVVIAPLLIIWLGPGIFSKILICSLIVFFPVLINTVVSIRAIPVSLYNLMHSLRATPIQILIKIEIPASLPVFLSGLRIGATLSVIGAVVGEFLGAIRGLGFLINVGRGQFDTALVYVAVFVLIAIALALYKSVAWIESHVLVWQGRKE